MKDRSFFTTGDGYRIAYRFDGSDDKPVLLLSNSIGTSLNMWDGQIEELTKHFRVLRYDNRGHGASDVPAGAYSLDRLGRDVIEMLDALHLNRVHVLGLSFGGLIAQWLAVRAPERVDRLILSNTSSFLGPVEQWDYLISSVLQASDMSETAETFLHNWFPQRMWDENSDVIESFRTVLLAMNPNGFAGTYAAIRDADMRRIASLISSPTLVIAGKYDTVTLPSHGELLATTVPGSKLIILPSVHLSNIEYQDEFLNAVLEFLLAK